MISLNLIIVQLHGGSKWLNYYEIKHTWNRKVCTDTPVILKLHCSFTPDSARSGVSRPILTTPSYLYSYVLWGFKVGSEMIASRSKIQD